MRLSEMQQKRKTCVRRQRKAYQTANAVCVWWRGSVRAGSVNRTQRVRVYACARGCAVAACVAVTQQP